jgi:outer membrane protein assembly factor BamB
MIGPMRLRGDGASRPSAAAASLRRGARNSAAALAVALAGCSGGDRAADPLVRLEVGENLGAMTAAGDDVWVNDFGDERLLRIDGRTGRVLARLPLGRRVAIAAGRDSIWALRWGGRFFRTPSGPLYRIDPATDRVTDRIPLGDDVVFGVLAGPRDVWVWGPRRVIRLEPGSGAITGAFAIDLEAGELTGAVVEGDGGLLATTGDGHLARVDATGILRNRREPALQGSELQAVAGRRAIASRGGGVIAVSADRGRLLWRSQLGFRVSTVLAHDGVLLVQGAAFRDDGDRLWALDPETGRVLASTTIPSFGTTGMALVGGSLWFATAAGEVIVIPELMVRLLLARARR